MRKSLLAKSIFRGSEKTVLAHTIDVVDSAKALFGKPAAPTRLGQKFAAMFGVVDIDRFLRNLFVAALLHDIGKANEEFQTAIDYANRQPPLRYTQSAYHEHISGMLLVSKFGKILRDSNQHDFSVILAAVVGHHRRTEPQILLERAISTNSNHQEFRELVEYVSKMSGLDWDGNIISPTYEIQSYEDLMEDISYELANIELESGKNAQFAAMRVL